MSASCMDLRDDRIFPSFSDCPHEHDLASSFYHEEAGETCRPSRHWCLLAEIVDVEYFLHLRLRTRDKMGREFKVCFHLGGENPLFYYNNIRIGHTIAILYPHRHDFLNRTVGISQTVASGLKVFPIRMHDLFALSGRIQNQVKKVDGKRACQACGKRSVLLLGCARCLLSWYCDKECQETGWLHKGHKQDCKLLKDEDLRSLFALNWDSFEEFWQFPLACARQ